jgi:hypothetical protein
MTWVLVILALSGNAIATVPGYQSQNQCEDAAVRLLQTPGIWGLSKAQAPKVLVRCIPGP